VSQTLIKRAEIGAHGDQNQGGFYAELPGWDLPTLLQMSCARAERVCVEVRCDGELGHIYMADGRLVHASVGTVIGEAAVALMLQWPGGNVALSDRPWPLKASIDAGAEHVLLRLAQAEDEAALTADSARPASPLGVRLDARGSTRPRATTAFALEPSDRSPLPVPASEPSQTPAPALATPREGQVIASVRIDMNGEIVAQNGHSDTLAPLVAYVTRMGALLGPQLGLESFEALSAELGKRRALVFVEGEEMVGLLLPPGTLHQELRQQLGL
jgi:hypothetical protein